MWTILEHEIRLGNVTTNTHTYTHICMPGSIFHFKTSNYME